MLESQQETKPDTPGSKKDHVDSFWDDLDVAANFNWQQLRGGSLEFNECCQQIQRADVDQQGQVEGK
jgi:hypothetical protein